MDYARLPDWLIYLAASAAVLVAAVSRQEHADTAEAPPPPPGAERVPLGPDSPFDPATVIRTGAHKGQHRGTAFAVAEGGVWLTASSEVAGCRHVALKVAEVALEQLRHAPRPRASRLRAIRPSSSCARPAGRRR